jgi:uncharacterized peroxidase-related enzyme
MKGQIVMSRLTPIIDHQCVQELAGIARKLHLAAGGVPNFLRLMAQSPAALRAYAQAEVALSKGLLAQPQREEISLAVAEINGSDYCLELHTQAGKKSGLTDEDVRLARQASATEGKTKAMLCFVQAVVLQRGEVNDVDYLAIRAAGFSEAEIIEILANVGLNIFLNYFNILARTDPDHAPEPEPKRILVGHDVL